MSRQAVYKGQSLSDSQPATTVGDVGKGAEILIMNTFSFADIYIYIYYLATNIFFLNANKYLRGKHSLNGSPV